MKVTFDSGRIEDKDYELLVLGLQEDNPPKEIAKEIDRHLDQTISNLVTSKEFRGTLNQTYLIPTLGKMKVKRILLVGLGKPAEFDLEKIRLASGRAVRIVRDLGLKSYSTSIYNYGFPLAEAAQSLVEGAELALYRFDKYKTTKEDVKEVKEMNIFAEGQVSEVRKSADVATVISRAVNFSRDLSNAPGNECPPRILAEAAQKVASESGLSCEVHGKEEIERLGMGGLLAVSRGSQEPPRFIVMKYQGSDEPPLVFIGKGLTFDSGGISIKPSEKMEEMKFDKSGGCTVLGAMKAIAELKLRVNVIGLIPATENLPGGSALKPGDVIKFYGGKTAEVINTDAEGRLILSDALAYASNFKPKAVVDLATLTGACVIALGAICTGLFTNDPSLKDKILSASQRTGEKVWELPLWKEYSEFIKSEVADVKNTGGRPAGAITATMFLKNFIGDYPWAHLDIAGTAWVQDGSLEKSYQPKGATGVGVRLLVELAKAYSG